MFFASVIVRTALQFWKPALCPVLPNARRAALEFNRPFVKGPTSDTALFRVVTNSLSELFVISVATIDFNFITPALIAGLPMSLRQTYERQVRRLANTPPNMPLPH
jgi:hypothetical protein